jgi:pyruvate carboxylase subunit B
MSPVSGGTCQPDIITMWHALRHTDFDLGVDIKKVREAEAVFQECMKDYIIPPEAMTVSPEITFSPLPGGALTANTQMLRDNGMMDKYPAIVEAMAETVEKGGFGTSVTPVSQFYFQQAFNNVMFGPWKRIAEGYGKMVLGYFGKTPVEPDKDVVKACADAMGLEPTTEKVVDINDKDPSKGVKAAKAMLEAEGLETTDENIFIAASCKEKGILYLTGKAQPNGIYKYDRKAEAAKAKGEYTVNVGGKAYGVKLTNGKATVNGVEYPVNIDFGIDEAAIESTKGAASAGAAVVASNAEATPVNAPMPGLILRIDVKEGQQVTKNQLLLVMEAMKMENEIYAPCDGVVTKISVTQGQQMQSDDQLLVIG